MAFRSLSAVAPASIMPGGSSTTVTCSSSGFAAEQCTSNGQQLKADQNVECADAAAGCIASDCCEASGILVTSGVH